MMFNTKANKGSVSIYLTMIITSVVLVFSILLGSVSNSKNIFIVKSSLVRHQDLILSDFSEKLYNDYGIMATDIPNIKQEDFNKITSSLSFITDFEVDGTKKLSSEALYDEIIRFSKPRFPVQAASGVIARLNSMFNEVNSIKKKDVITTEEEITSENNFQFGDLLKYLILLCEKWPKKEIEDDDSFHISDISQILKDYEEADKYTNDFVKDIKTNLSFSEETLMKLSDTLTKFYSIETNSMYQFILFNHYISEMFSCQTDSLITNENEINRKNMRGTELGLINHISEYEIEKIIFGNEDENQNKFFAQASIGGIRLVTQILCYLLDTKKREKIKTIATTLCAAAAIISAGSVIIDPQTAEILLVIVFATVDTYKECNNLFNGKSVELIPVDGFEKIKIYYSDYLKLMLLAVSKESKLKRIESIIKNNIPINNECFFIGVKIGCKYKGVRYQFEGFYH